MIVKTFPSKDINSLKVNDNSKMNKIKQSLENLMVNIDKVLTHTNKISEIYYDSVYKMVYHIVRDKGEIELKESLQNKIINYLDNQLKEDTSFLIEDSDFFKSLVDKYCEFIVKIKRIQKILLYYETNYINKKNLPSFTRFSQNIYNKVVFTKSFIYRTCEFINREVSTDRLDYSTHFNSNINRRKIYNLINLIFHIDHNLFFSKFELILLETSEKFYINEFIAKINHLSTKEFFNYLETKILEEEVRIREFNLIHSKSKFMIILFNKLFLEIFLKNEERVKLHLKQLIEENDIESLLTMNKICVKVNDLSNSFLVQNEDVNIKDDNINNNTNKTNNNTNSYSNKNCINSTNKSQDFFMEMFLKTLSKVISNLITDLVINTSNNTNTNININSNKPSPHSEFIINLSIFITKIEGLKTKLSSLYKKNHIIIINNIIKACISQLNKENQITKALCASIDFHFKPISKIPINDLLVFLDNQFILLKYIDEKDVFEFQHRKLLSRRLLSPNSYNEEIEIMLISKLKIEYGNIYTHRLEVMINDLVSSQHTNNQYKNSKYYHKNPSLNTFQHNQISNNESIAFNPNFNQTSSNSSNAFYNKNFSMLYYEAYNLNINILTQGNWPMNNTNNNKLDILLKKIESEPLLKALLPLSNFNIFYLKNFPGKILYMNFLLGTIELSMKFKNRNYFMTMTTLQGILLLLLNRSNNSNNSNSNTTNNPTNSKSISLNYITSIIALESKKELISHITTLEKMNLIVLNQDNYSFNSNFYSKHLRLFFTASKDKSDTTDKSDDLQIENYRKSLLESNIIRIMKAKRHILHNNLVNEIVMAVYNKFVPDNILIKSRIESLVDRMFISRDDKDYNAYVYNS